MNNNQYPPQVKKDNLVQSVKSQMQLRVFAVGGLLLVLLYLNFALPSLPHLRLVSLLALIVSVVFFVAGRYILEYQKQLSVENIQQSLLSIFCLEIITSWLVFYVLTPLLVLYSFPLIYLAILFFAFYFLSISTFLFANIHQQILSLLSWIVLLLLSMNYYNVLSQQASGASPSLSIHLFIPAVAGGLTVFGVQAISYFFGQRSKQITQSLRQVNQGLQRKLSEKNEELYQLQQELDEAKQVLMIRSRAYNRELQELARQFRKEVAGSSEKEPPAEEIKRMGKTTSALLNILEDNEKARQAAEEEQRKTTAIIENFVDGLITVNQNNIITTVNPRAQEIFHLQQTEGHPINILTENELFAPILEEIMTDGKLQEVNRDRVTLDDTTIEVTTVSITGVEGADQWLIVLRDVSRDVLVQQMKTEFVSVAAHQLRTPLSAIKWSLKMLEKEGDLNEKQEDLLQKTYISNEHLIQLINDLLNVSHIEEGRFLGEVEKQSLVPIVQSVIKEHQQYIEKQDLDLQFKLQLTKEQELPLVKIDKEKMKIVMDNLIGNAIDYTPSGGRVRVRLTRQGNKIRFSVEDNGIGIPEEQQDRVFERFFRSKNALKKKTEGTGLGLFITKNIIEAHHGKIWFESVRGQGTTFYFTLPIT